MWQLEPLDEKASGYNLPKYIFKTGTIYSNYIYMYCIYLISKLTFCFTPGSVQSSDWHLVSCVGIYLVSPLSNMYTSSFVRTLTLFLNPRYFETCTLEFGANRDSFETTVNWGGPGPTDGLVWCALFLTRAEAGCSQDWDHSMHSLPLSLSTIASIIVIPGPVATKYTVHFCECVLYKL